MYIKAKVFASAKKEIFKKINEDHFEIYVKEKAKNNQANKRIIELISFHYSIPINKIRIINGHRTPTKLLVIDMV